MKHQEKAEMTKLTLKTICLGMLALFAIACGDAGDGQLGEDPGFVEDGDFVDGEDQNDLEDEDNLDGEDDQNGDEEVVEGPLCGDGFVDDGEQCDDGNAEDGDGCSSACENEVVDILGQLAIDITVDDLESNEAPLSDRCAGAIEITLDIAEGSITGDGRCSLDNFNNFMDYELDATIVETGVVEGDVTVVFNGQPHVLPATGFIDKDLLTLEFEGVTMLTGRLRGIWAGEIEAARN